jgi:hypothetical protein
MDAALELSRPIEFFVHRAKTSREFFERSGIKGATKYRVYVERVRDPSVDSNDRDAVIDTYSNWYYSLNEKGKVLCKFKERYVDGSVIRSLDQAKYDDAGKGEDTMTRRCLITAWNRLGIVRDKELEFTGLKKTYAGDRAILVEDMATADNEISPLIAVTKI